MEKRGSITLPPLEGKRVYFASDQHFGMPNPADSLVRERHFIKWLDRIKPDASALFLLGDLFDFWFEYQQVIPKGGVRVLGKLAAFSDAGIPIFFFAGNHDLWVRDYFEKELQIKIFHQSQVFVMENKSFFIAHGDGLGPEDKGYKRMKKIFKNPLASWAFRWLHPDVGVWLGNYFSQKNKLLSGRENHQFLGENKEWLALYAQRKLEQRHYDFFVFGHRHLPLNIELGKARYVNTGDWISHFSYAVFDGKSLELQFFKP